MRNPHQQLPTNYIAATAITTAIATAAAAAAAEAAATAAGVLLIIPGVVNVKSSDGNSGCSSIDGH